MRVLSVDNTRELRILQTKSSPVNKIDDEILGLVDRIERVISAGGTAGFSAVQLGCFKRVFVINVASELFNMAQDVKVISGYHSLNGTNLVCVNPEIVSLSGDIVTLFEGCLSASSYGMIGISRPRHIDLKYTDLMGNECVIRAYNWLARCIQHEMDHLNGVLLANMVDNIRNPDTKSVSEEDFSTVHIFLLNKEASNDS
ncbi:peptide deformylase [Anaplasma capra]|uniref:peptide deformylase n=1 Tax=Anaplasma capra TaxID=1562740 RepID=UPI0021D60D0B|nr:peptide deformylase [Anaplasma capra]MCU7611343.1 peptide deformylase [Anaplasma capra]MCU7612417.1 peptide deformylase [Anaplasma capra]